MCDVQLSPGFSVASVLHHCQEHLQLTNIHDIPFRQTRRSKSGGDIPAVVVLVTNPDGVVYEHAAGKLNVASNVPLAVNAVFEIASMTKPVTSAAIMTLVESRHLNLDDAAAKYIRAIADMK